MHIIDCHGGAEAFYRHRKFNLWTLQAKPLNQIDLKLDICDCVTEFHP